MPADLQLLIGADDTIVRIAWVISAKILRKHPEVAPVLDNLTVALNLWDAFALQSEGEDGRIRIYLPARPDGHRIRIVLGQGRYGTTNIVSVFDVRKRGWINEVLRRRGE